MLTETKFQNIYSQIIALAERNYQQGSYENTLKKIEVLSKIAYSYNFFYTDRKLENILQNISNEILPTINQPTIQKGKFVFYDSFGMSNRGLVHQYICALISWDVEFLYICGSYGKHKSSVLIKEIEQYTKAEVFIVGKYLSRIEKISQINDKLLSYQPEKAFLYLTPWDTSAITAFCAHPHINRYQINLTDHAFWLGTSCMDYSIEFRDYGCTLSSQKRDILKEKLLMQPYYPIVLPTKYKGLPAEITSDKVVLFSGGAYYKVYGGDNLYFSILKRILDENPNAVIVFAGFGDEAPFRAFIEENKLEKRLFLLGFRGDINELFAHTDIYLGTFPLCGGLMSQYAAINSKPILAYTTPGSACNYVEGIVYHGNKQSALLTHTALDSFFAEAKKLIDNKEYREAVGRSIFDGVITPEQFNKELYHLVTTHSNIRTIGTETIDYNNHSQIYLEIENKYFHTLEKLLFYKIKIYSIRLFPCLAIKYIPLLYFKSWKRKLVDVVRKRFKKLF